MDIVLREQVLREIEYILKYEYLTEQEKHWYDDIWGDAKEAYGYWFGSGGKQALKHPLDTIVDAGRATAMMGKDIVAAWEEDPWAFVQGLIDVISLFDPTGIADIINATIYYARGDNLMGTISAICGALTMIGAIASIADGAGVPLVILGKTVKGVVLFKDAEKLISICQKLVKFGPDIIQTVKRLTTYRSIGSKAAIVLEKLIGFFARIKTFLANTKMFKTFDEAFRYVFGAGEVLITKGPINSAEFSQLAKKSKSFSKTTALAQGGGLISTAGVVASVGEEARKRKGAEYYVKNNTYVCQVTNCGTIYYNKEQKEYYDRNTGRRDEHFNYAMKIALLLNQSAEITKR